VKVAAVVGVLSFSLASCSGGDNCAEVGEDVFENLERVSGLAAQLNLPTKESEAAVIVGAAKGVSDLGGKRVKVCLRASGAETEFRILSTTTHPLEQWTRISTLMRRGE